MLRVKLWILSAIKHCRNLTSLVPTKCSYTSVRIYKHHISSYIVHKTVWRSPVLWKLYISKYNLLGLWHNSVFQSIPDWSCWQYNSCTASCGLHRNTNCNNKHCSYWMVDCVTDDTACDSALLPTQEEDKIWRVSYCLCNRNVYMISIVMTSWITVILSMNLAHISMHA